MATNWNEFTPVDSAAPKPKGGVDWKNFEPLKPAEAPGLLRSIGDLAVKGAQGVVDLGSSVVGAASLATGGAAGNAMRAIGYDPEATNQALGELLSPAQREAEANVQAASGFVDTLVALARNPRAVTGAVAESLPGVFALGGVQAKAAELIATKAAAKYGGLATEAGAAAAKQAVEDAAGRLMWMGAAGEGIQTAGQQADQAQAAGREYSDYALPAVAAGAGTALIGRAAGKLMGDAETSLFTGAKSAGVAGSLPARVGKSIFSEGVLEEMPQSAQEQIWQNIGMGKPWDEGVANQAAMGLVTGGAMGGAMGALQGGKSAEAAPATPTPPSMAPGAESAASVLGAGTVDDAIKAAGEALTVPAGFDADKALDRLDAQRKKDEDALRFMGPVSKERPRAATVPGGTTAADVKLSEGDAIGAFSDRVLNVREQLQDPAVRERLRTELGDGALNEALYYASTADDTSISLPDKTRERFVALAESIIEQGLFKREGRPGVGMDAAPASPGLLTSTDTLRIGVDTTPTGTVRVDSAGNAVPETAADAINTRQAQQQRTEARNARAELGKQTPQGLNPNQAIRLGGPIPTGEATELPDAGLDVAEFDALPVGEATEVPYIPTGDATELPKKIPTGKATDAEVETILADDLLTGDGMPYGSKTGANIRARREGLSLDHVVEIPGAGWVIRPDLNARAEAAAQAPAPINAQPNNTRSTTAADVLKGRPNGPDASGNGQQQPADAGRGDRAGLLPDERPADVLPGAASPAGQGGMGGGDAGRLARSGNPALTSGATVTLDGKAWTVTEATDKVAKLDDGTGTKKVVRAGSSTWLKITDATQAAAPAQPQAAQAPAPAGAATAEQPGAVVPGAGSAAVEADGVGTVAEAAAGVRAIRAELTEVRGGLPDSALSQQTRERLFVLRSRLQAAEAKVSAMRRKAVQELSDPPAAAPAPTPAAAADTRKAEMRPYRRADGSIGYEAVPIIEPEARAPAGDTLRERIKKDGEARRAAEKAGADAYQADADRRPPDDMVNPSEREAWLKGYDNAPPVQKPAAPAASANTVFTEDAAEKARAILRRKLGQLNSGLDPEMMQAGITLAGYHIEKGARSFIAYANAMLGDLGDSVKPYLKSWYMAVAFDPRATGFADKMDDPSLVKAINVDDFRVPTAAPDGPADSADAQSSGAQPRQEQTNEQRTQPAVDQGDQGRASAADGRRGTLAQQPDARPNQGSVATGQPEDVGAAVNGRADDATGVRAASEDVGSASGADSGRDASDGRPRGGRARASDAGARSGGERRPAGRPAKPARQPDVVDPATVSPANTGPGDFVIADPLKIVGGGQVARFEKNKAAIELRNKLIEAGRQPTREEQEVLAGYTGWGSFGQELFKGSWDKPAPKDGWQARDAWLRDNLGRKEWEGLQTSIINAHYTDPPTVMAMWDMVQRMGFTGGRMLEPSIGIGNFYGLTPAAIAARSQRAGIELDEVTGSMAQMLYPQANIQIKGYEQSTTPDNFYDLVIGNWPFFEHGPADRRYNRLSPTLHDYFFLKAIDQTRPGGLIVGITTKGTMDKKGVGARMEMARKAELVAAFRLPSGAFEEYAGTKVVTDIVILRKREKPIGIVDKEGWIEVLDHDTKEGTKVPVNEYFHRNPSHVIGEIDFGHGTTTFRPGLIVHRPDDMMGQLRRIVGLTPEGVYKPADNAKHISYVANHTSDRTNALTKTAQGFFVVAGEYLAPANEVQKYALKDPAKTAQREAELTALIDMRRMYGELIDAERAGNAEGKRESLRKAYADFVKANGPLADSFGLNYLRKIDDPFYPSLAALEVATEDASGKRTYRPAAILNASTMRGAKAMTSPGIADAFVLARNEAVNPTLARIAELSGKSEAEAKSALIQAGAAFELPNGDFTPADMYLSGNVREKMREARNALDAGNTAMQRNVDALAKVIPADVPYYKIETQMGATWVTGAAYADYIAHMLGLDSAKGIEVAFKGGAWSIDFDSALNHRPQARSGFGSAEVPFKRLVRAAIANQTINVKRKDSDGKEYVDEDATKEVNARIADMRTKFGEWLWQDPTRRTELEREYNEVRNAYATPQFDGSFLGFQGMALSLGRGPFNLREHQVNAIWRALVTRKSLNAHEVGTGKTFTMGGIAVESRRYGIAKKPMLFAHNANSKSVAHEIQMMYPAAKVLYVDNLSKENLKTRMMQIANDDWDVVVLPHSVIDRIGFKEETLMGMAQEELLDLAVAAEDAAAEDNVTIESPMWEDEEELNKLRSVTAKQLVKQRLKIVSTIKKLAQQASKDGAVSFEDMGVDMILVDEAHEFKKPPIATKMKMKGLQTQTSNRSIAMMFLTKYVRSMNNGGNVHLFTGTPITNTMTEVFHMMRYMMQEEMKDASLADWDGWFGSFAREVNDVELTPAGEYEAVTRLQAFINVPELRRMIGQYMDVVFADDMPEMRPREINGKKLSDKSLTDTERADLLNGRTENAADRPYKKVVNESSDMTPEQMDVFRQVQGWAKRWKSMSKKDRKAAMLEGKPESPIIHEGIAAKASFDVRLVDAIRNAGKEGTPEMAPHPDSKPARVVKNLLEIYRGHPQANQVVFMEQGMAKSVSRREGPVGGKRDVNYPAFSTVADMIERLVQAGVPREQIALVDGATSKDKRKEIADAMNSGKIRIVFGSTDSLGVGVNMQRNLRAMHHMDAPWMPGELEQRNGRGHRQGNQWNTVLEYRYLTDRLDGRRWQVLAIKQRFITDFMKSKGDVRVIEGDAASDEGGDIVSTFSEAAGDPRILVREKLKKKLDQLQSRERIHGQAVSDAIREVNSARNSVESAAKKLREVQQAGVRAQMTALIESQAGDRFRLTVGNESFTDRAEAADRLPAWLAANMRLGEDMREIGTYGDEPLYALWPQYGNRANLRLRLAGETVESNGDSLRSLEAQLRNRRDDVEAQYEGIIKRAEERGAHAAKVAKEPFHLAEQLSKMAKQLADLEADIAMNPVAPPYWLRNGAPMDTEVFRDGKPFLVTGHRWSADGWFVLARDAKGETAIPYMEAEDAQGMPLYEAHEFEPPEVAKKDDKPAADAPQPTKFSRSNGARTTGVPDADAKAVAEAIRKALPKSPPIHLYESVDQAPKNLREAIYDAGADRDVEAVYHGGEIHVFPGNIESVERMAFVVGNHEVRHHGLRTLLGPELGPTMLQLWSNEKLRRAALRQMEDGKADSRVLAVEEALADMPIEELQQLKGWTNIVAGLRRFLRNVAAKLREAGFTALASALEPKRWTDADVAALVQRAEDVSRTGVRGGYRTGGTVFSRGPGAVLDGLKNLRDVSLPAGYMVNDFIQSEGKLSWWHKTVGSMHNLAERNALFKPVYDAAQDFLKSVSTYATEAADLAPTLLPKLETLRDIGKAPLSAEDTKAISAPIFEGTLNWTRDDMGQPVRTDEVGTAGIVWTDAELRNRFKLSPKQIGLYREFRAATNKSLTDLAISDMLRFAGTDAASVRDQAMAAGNVRAAADMLEAHLTALMDAQPERAGVLMDTIKTVGEKADRVAGLIARGYAPLSRFGKHLVDVVDANGERLYFGMFEAGYEANRMARKMREAYPGAQVKQGTTSETAYQMFAGISPETLELFGDMLGLEANGNDAASQAFQQYLKLAKNNRSAMKRLIERKGVAGFSEDAGRVLAGFVYSNARQTAKHLHMGRLSEAVTTVRGEKGEGELTDAAEALRQYVSNPVNEAQAIKGVLFAQFLGGSVAAGLVNLTQVPMVTFPYLTQFSTVSQAAKQMKSALADALKWETEKDKARRTTGDATLDAAMKVAEEEGTISPQEVHSLIAQAGGGGSLRAGDGTKAGDAYAKGQNLLSKIALGWGRPFAVTEQFNRRATFIAAYRTAVEQGMQDPAKFARETVEQTQFSYTKANRPQWARGAVGSLLFTFKTYSISYVELLGRMLKNGPEGRRAARVALAVLFLMSGAQGLPGADDLDDLIDGLLQRMGYNFSSKKAKREFFAGILGDGAADFLMSGVSGLPGVPIDVAGRLGLGNLIPGTGLVTKKADYGQDVAELAGPAGKLAQQALTGVGKLVEGDIGGATKAVLPVALANAMKGYDMASTGMYRDERGRKVMDVDGFDAIAKTIGFQPNDVAKVQRVSREVQSEVAQVKMREAEIAEKWAQGIFEKDADKQQAAKDALARWNEDNPDSRIVIKPAQILKRVTEMRMSKTERLAKTAPKEMRATVRRELEAAQ